ncbi:MAG: hypothetical protein PF503_10205 [Desulfobacula sp.]|jgi:hypothetical protein|nr:hypothetical protein [Desulfobacula sp.]
MGIAFNQVKEALVKLDELQASHITAFETQILPDLDKQIAQRKEGFSDLKKYLEAFLQEPEIMDMVKKEQLIQNIKDHILLLMYQNTTLALKVETHKCGLENSMKKITRGRRVIQAYGSPPSKRHQSKVINLQN